MIKLNKKQLVEAIKSVEAETSAEIKVHVEKNCKIDPIERAENIFHKLELHKTQHRNSVLIYVATKHRKMAILGDEGIHNKVGDDFWQEVYEILKHDFKNNNFTEGLQSAILKVGEKLKIYFPRAENDKNEISDSIS